MPAKSADRRVQVNVRMRESERRELVEAAHKQRTTLNGTMMGLMMGALRHERLLHANQVVENTVRALEPLFSDLDELNVSGDYRRAVGKLLALLRPLLATRAIAGEVGEALRAVIDEIDIAEGVVQKELGRRLARMRTTGARK